MINTINEIKDIADCIPGYTVVYKITDKLERIYYSKNVPELTGHSAEEFVNVSIDNPFGLIISGDRNEISKKLMGAVAQHSNVDFSYRLVHKSGRLIWARAHANYIGDMDGGAIYLTSIFDVTDEWESKNIILDASDRGIVVFDKNTKAVLYGNSKFFQYAGTTEEKCLGGACYDVVCGAGVYNEEKCICFKALGQTEPYISYNQAVDSYYAITASEICRSNVQSYYES